MNEDTGAWLLFGDEEERLEGCGDAISSYNQSVVASRIGGRVKRARGESESERSTVNAPVNHASGIAAAWAQLSSFGFLVSIPASTTTVKRAQVTNQLSDICWTRDTPSRTVFGVGSLCDGETRSSVSAEVAYAQVGRSLLHALRKRGRSWQCASEDQAKRVEHVSRIYHSASGRPKHRYRQLTPRRPPSMSWKPARRPP